MLQGNLTGPTGAAGSDGADGVDISASFAESYGPASNQTIGAAAPGTILDLDVSLNEEPAADWSVSATGVWTYTGTDTITVMVMVSGIYDTSGAHATITQSIEKNGTVITGSSLSKGLQNAVRREKQIVSNAITTLATNDTLQGRGLSALLVGATVLLFRASGHMTILRIK